MRRNITQRTLTEKGAQKAERLATIGEMSAFLAHEIRNPLFAIGGFAHSLMRSTNLNQGERDKLNIILQETERLDRLLKSVLDFARPSPGNGGEVDVAAIIAETVDLMKIGYCTQDIVLDTSVAQNLPRVKGDADLFKQCLINLVKNSVEAMPGGGRIAIRADLADRRVRVEVEDNGPGMPKALLEKVFSPFFTTKDKGYGLGLAMIKKVVEDFEGRVELTSTEGGGTTVALSLSPVLAGERGGAKDTPGPQEPSGPA
jgi:signal transduction histidine kinase